MSCSPLLSIALRVGGLFFVLSVPAILISTRKDEIVPVFKMGIFALIAEHHAAASLLSFSAVLATIIYVGFLVIYRLYLSPLAKFPGPKLAAATGWMEFYYDFFKVGHYMYEIEKMHEKYGTQIIFASFRV